MNEIGKNRIVSNCWGLNVPHRKHLTQPKGEYDTLMMCWCTMFHVGEDSGTDQSEAQEAYLRQKYGSEEGAKYAIEIKNTHGFWPKQTIAPKTSMPVLTAADLKAAVEQVKQASIKPLDGQEITFIAHPKTIDDYVDEIAKEMSYKMGESMNALIQSTGGVKMENYADYVNFSDLVGSENAEGNSPTFKPSPYQDFPKNVELGAGIKIVNTGNGMFRVEADLKEVLKAVASAVNTDKKDRKFR